MALYYRAMDASYRGEKGEANKLFQEIVARGDQKTYWHHVAQEKLRTS